MKFCPLFWQRKNPSSPCSKLAKSKPLTGTLICSFICLVPLSVCYVPCLFKLSRSRAARWSQGNLSCLFLIRPVRHCTPANIALARKSKAPVVPHRSFRLFLRVLLSWSSASLCRTSSHGIQQTQSSC